MPEQSELPRFEPLHSAHAIQQCAITIQFSQIIDDSQLAECDAAMKQFVDSQELPRRSELRTMVLAISIGMPGMAGGGPQGGSLGYQFQKLLPDGGVEAELRLDRQSLTYRTEKYTRWDQIWGNARKILTPLIPIYLRVGTLSLLGLNYVDKFVWSGPPESANPATLLRGDLPFITPHVLNLRDFWHSHTGAFHRHDLLTKRLVNVNVDCLDELRLGSLARVVNILTVINDMFNQPGYESLKLGVDALNFVDAHLASLHDYDKAILRQMLSANMGARIGLDS